MGSSPSPLGPDSLAVAQKRQPHLRIHAINIFVHDQEKSLRFYLDQLGFSLVGDVRFGSGDRWVAVAPPDGSTVLSLVAPKPDSKEVQFIGRATQIVFVTEDVPAKYSEWRKRGVRFQYTPRLKRIRYEKQVSGPGSPDRAFSYQDSGARPGKEPVSSIWTARLQLVGDVCSGSGIAGSLLHLLTAALSFAGRLKADSKNVQLIGCATQIVFVTEDVLVKYREWWKRGRFASVDAPPETYRYEKQVSGLGSPMPSPAPDQPPVWGGVITHFKDIDGNSFALVSYDEESRAVEAQRRAAAAKVESERRAAQELEIAKQVQLGLFPQSLPSLATLDYSGICIQARQVGGDYYDFLHLGQDRFGLVIGDISGKGIAAALLMSNLQANLRSQCAIASDQPRRFLQLVNRLFYENSPEGAYATLFFGEYDERTRRLRYVNCGHLSALLLRNDGAMERLESTCTVLGLFKEWDCTIGESMLSCGDTLAIYTDGITEAFDAAGEEFGERRVIDSLLRHREQLATQLVASIVDDVRKFSPHEQSDDITLIVAKCR